MDSVIVKKANGDCHLLDYPADGSEPMEDGPYSFNVARYLRPSAEIREVSRSTRPRYSHPTADMLGRCSS